MVVVWCVDVITKYMGKWWKSNNINDTSRLRFIHKVCSLNWTNYVLWARNKWQSPFSPDAIYRALSNWIGIERYAHFYLRLFRKCVCIFLVENTKNGSFMCSFDLMLIFFYLFFFFTSFIRLLYVSFWAIDFEFNMKIQLLQMLPPPSINSNKMKKKNHRKPTTSDNWFEEFTIENTMNIHIIHLILFTRLKFH